LLSDKLTAFAPVTTGDPFVTNNGNLMVMQVIKQLYDLGEFFDIASDFEEVKIAYDATLDRIFQKNRHKRIILCLFVVTTY